MTNDSRHTVSISWQWDRFQTAFKDFHGDAVATSFQHDTLGEMDDHNCYDCPARTMVSGTKRARMIFR